MNKNEFFRKATLKICGNLEIEQALQDLLFMLAHVMPVTRLYLQYHDHDYSAMRTIAYADKTECRKMDLLTPLSDSAKKKPVMRQRNGMPFSSTSRGNFPSPAKWGNFTT